jgi:U3 small nucleolar RNA-associated protein 19
MGSGSLPPPTKKRKVSAKAETKTKSTLIADAERLENSLAQAIATKGSLNPLSDLLSLVQTAHSAEELSKVIFALYRTFVTLISGGRFTSTDAEDENAKIVRTWLWERLNSFADVLGCILRDEDATLRVRNNF